ncbi:MAG: DDE-type integrase/transposase/recombinase, partial [Candidatus Thiodiazotropha taylori]|nr:DDE-type integrase/transposase/recombinase [Candidatus Thiodiazotropha taylori]MCW4310584.1 DDE-type integrase/transposase/recombinase [Candidatus Thiodiazotropha endolucinida]
MIADFDKNTGETGAVKKVAFNEGHVGDDKVVTPPCMGSVLHKVACPNDGGDHVAALPCDGTIQKQSVSFVKQDKDPAFTGPSIADDDIRGSEAHTSICLGPGAAEVLSSEMLHGMTQFGVPHFKHATINSVCDGVDAEAHEILETRQAYDCYCCKTTACYIEDWWDQFEDGTLFGNLFEIEDNPDELNVAHAGVTTIGEARNGNPQCLSENMMDTNNTNTGSLQTDQGCLHSTCQLCLKVSQRTGGSGQSTSTCVETEECYDITQENIQTKQEDDDVLKYMLQWKRDDDKPHWSTVAPFCRELKAYWHEWDTIELKDNILYKKRFSDVGNDVEYLLLMPAVLRKEAFRQLHENITGGHLGRRKTYVKIRNRFYWCNMQKDVSYWCRTCSTCGSRKMPHRNAKAPMRQYNVGCPMERIGLDICGPYPVSNKGHRYLLVVSCYFTKWVDAIPLKTQEAKYVASKLVNRFISIFGVPLQLHTDLGSNFESKVFQEICKLLGIDKTRTTVRRPQSDGMVERLNRSIQNMISSYISDTQKDWDEHIPLLMLAYRSSIHETTGVSPAMMMFGRELTLPIDLTLGRPVSEDRLCVTEHAYQLEQKLLNVHDFARKHLNISSESMKRRYDIKAHKIKYEVGDAVWYYNPKRKIGFNPKLQRPWKGPMIVVECLNEVL